MARSNPKPILLVEDDDGDVLLFKRALKKAALNNPVYAVTAASMAMHYLLAEGIFADRSAYPFPSVIVIDFHLPDFNGFELLKWIRALPQFQSVHCFVLTGDSRPSLSEECYAVGANSFLCKPCTHEHLRQLAQSFPQHWFSQPPSLSS
jgi:CheY-like chemotaxis protein